MQNFFIYVMKFLIKMPTIIIKEIILQFIKKVLRQYS